MRPIPLQRLSAARRLGTPHSMRSVFGSNEEVSGRSLDAARHPDRLTVRVLDDEPSGLTRGSFLRRVVVGASATSALTVVVLGLPRLATSAPSARQDRSILNFLLLLERTQAAFYAEALRRGSLRGELRQFAQVVGAHERAHAAELVAALGSAAEAPPHLELSAVTADADRVAAPRSCSRTSRSTGTTARAVDVTPEGLRTVLRIAPVEARQAAWARDLAGAVPAPRAADPLPTEEQVRSALRETGIVAEAGP